MERNNPSRNLERETRPNTITIWKDSARSKAARKKKARLWNIATIQITLAATKSAAKREIPKFSRTLEK